MTNKEAIEILTAKAECMRRETSGIDIDCNHRNCDECDLCYKQGTTGDQRKALGVAISALQAQDVPDVNVGGTISRQAAIDALMDEFKRIPTTAIRAKNRIDRLPHAEPEGWLEQNKAKILQAGMEGREIEFRIGGRLFAIREKAQ